MKLPPGDLEGDVAALVLAGGQSSRMGRDKALLEIAGKSLVARALEILHASGLKAKIAGARSPLGAFADVISDSEPDAGQGPLAGICSAFANVDAQRAVFLPVDMPLVPSSLISYLLRHSAVTEALITVPSINGFAQTFPAVIHRAALPIFQALLAHGDRGCFSAYRSAAARLESALSILPVELLVQSGQICHPEGLLASFWFLNVNTRQDLTRAEMLIADALRVS